MITAARKSKLTLSRCAGSTYLLVLATSMLVTIIGLASLFAVRVQRRSAQIAKDSACARFYSQAAVELGLLFVSQDPNWRTTRPNGAWLSNKPLGSGSFTLEGIDPADGNLGNSKYDSAVLTGTGLSGQTCQRTQVVLVPVIKPLEALGTCLHASGKVTIKAGWQITVVGGSVSTNGVLDNDNTIDGDAEAAQTEHTGTITGLLTAPAASKRMPDAQVISSYISRATTLPVTGGTVNAVVLSPSYTPWGSTNPDGVYFISLGSDMTIKNSRINGTLIVRTNTKKLTLGEAVFMHSYKTDYPVLIVDGDLVIGIRTCDYTLSEASNTTNYNPVVAPYEGQWNVDLLDEYPNEIRGLVHVKGSLNLQQTARIRGVVICEGTVTCEGQNTVLRDTALYASPPQGYTFVDSMAISPGSWKQVVN